MSNRNKEELATFFKIMRIAKKNSRGNMRIRRLIVDLLLYNHCRSSSGGYTRFRETCVQEYRLLKQCNKLIKEG